MNNDDLKTVVVKDFLSTEEYTSIYRTINSQISKNLEAGKDKYEEGFEVVNNNGFVVYFDNFEPIVLAAIKEKLEKAINAPVHKPGVLFARYTRDSGYRPRLRPHADRAINRPSVTATLELDSSIDWDIYVNDDGYNLLKNEILIFSGSRDIHWRPDIEFGNSDYFDVIILQTSMDIEDGTILDEEYFREMDKKSGQYISKYRHMLERSLDDESQRV